MTLRLFACCSCVMTYFAGTSQAASVGFEALPLGTIFGSPNQNPGDSIFSEDGVQAYIHPFFFAPGGSVFHTAKVYNSTGPFPDFPSNFNFATASGHVMYLSNVGMQFVFTGVGHPVNRVSFDFAFGGGDLNFSANDSNLYLYIPPDQTAVAPGVTITTTFNMLTQLGHMELNGPITKLQIGGQEFAMDNLMVIPEPLSMLPMITGFFLFRRRLRPINC